MRVMLLEFHVFISLIGILSGLVVLCGMLTGRPFGAWTALFLATTIATSVTGFPVPPFGFTPAKVLRVISLVLLALAIAALYGFRLACAWRHVRHACRYTAAPAGRPPSVSQSGGVVSRR
jgi:Zn-dependent protease with chaperone function